MRQIKFRAWNKIEKTIGEPFSLQVAIGSRVYNGVDTDGAEYMQFTGLTDKNGREIYEGDILDVPWSEKPVGPVTFNDGWFCIEVKETEDNPDYSAPIDGEESEIIGNIYENPELIAAI
jgi:uncharacterized phage protein (TIGR01671 family)